MDFARVLHELAGHFATEGLPWAVAGGVAMAAYGRPRTREPFELGPGRPASEHEGEPSGGSVGSFGDDRSPGPGAGDATR